MKRKQNTAPIVLAVFSDLHCGSTLGLCPPVVNLDDGGSYRASAGQRWLWRNWLDYCEQAKAVAKLNKAKLIAVANGDLTEGNHHHTRALIGSGNETLQERIAEQCLGKLLEYADAAYFTRGTSVHVGGQAKLEEKIADNWTITQRHSEAAATWYHLKLEANGTRFDIAHHGQLGRLMWTKANALGKIAIQAEVKGYRHGKPPNVLIRSHLHQYANSHDNYPVQVIATPAWQLVTGYVHHIDPGALADIGGLIFICHPGGRYNVVVSRYEPKPDPIQRIEP
jgi:hypothetical protein